MRFGHTPAQDALRVRVRALLEELSPPSEVRRLMETETGFDPAAWQRLAVEEGVHAVHLPASVGGGLGWVELAVVLEEAGRVLLAAPLMSTAVAAAVLLDSTGDGQVGDVLAAVGGGRAIATLAVAEPGSGRWDEAGVQTRAARSPAGGWRLNGRKSFVVDGCIADYLLVAARRDDSDEVGLFLVEAEAAGVSRSPLATVDTTRRQAEVTLAAAPARALRGTLEGAVELAVVALAAEQVGGAQRCLDRAVAHAMRRVQFGRPIGSFQAVKHLCAEMLLDLESARGVAFAAATAAAGGGSDLPAAAAAAKSCCSEAYVRIATDSLHVRGGLGFTWDDDAHLYFKRARSSALLFGSPTHHRELLARHLDL